MKIFKYDLRFNTLFQKGIKSYNDNFFIALITGYQGSGKSYLGTMLVNELNDRPIVTNVKSLKIPNRKIKYITKIEEIYSIDDKNCVFLIDEISKRYTKECKQDTQFYAWLQQSRKHSRYVYLITQEYLQVPQWLRGVANKVYTTRKLPFHLFITSLGVPVLNNDTKEWETDNYLFIIYKRIKKIADLYNTLEYVNTL